MGSKSISPKSNTSGSSATRYDNRDRCIPSGLGCPASGVPDRGGMVNRRETDAYQCTGAAGSVSCPEDLCQRQITFKCVSSNGQHVSQSLHKPFGGDTLPSAELTGSSDVEMVPGSPHFSNSRTPPRQIADEESRVVRDRCDWMIHPNLFSHGIPWQKPQMCSPRIGVSFRDMRILRGVSF